MNLNLNNAAAQIDKEFNDHMLLMGNDDDLEELLDCDDIEQTAFIGSSKHLMNIIDHTLSCIDERLAYKRASHGHGFAANTQRKVAV